MDMDFGNDFTESYDEKSRKYVDDLDFQKLAEIRSKDLRDLTDADLITIGLRKINHEEIDCLYCYEDLNGIKVYVSFENDKVELLGFMLKKLKEINSTSELIDETLTKWRLKMEGGK
jgi:hypothetical protein